MRRRLAQIVFALLMTLVSTTRAGELKLPHVFGSHMVLQRDMPLPVWGRATAGKAVKVSFAGQVKDATAGADGAWRVKLDPLPASAEGRTLTVECEGETVGFEDVLVGEVWLCSGQSNMEWVVHGCVNAQDEIAAANFPLIRHIAVPKRPAGAPEWDFDANWNVCQPGTAGGFTAVGFFFARNIHAELKVPVGLINSSWGGTLIEPWTPPEGFAAVPALASIHKRVLTTDPHSTEYKQLVSKHLADTETWLKSARELFAGEKALPKQPPFPQEALPVTSVADGAHQQPTALYNGMIAPLVGFAIRGALWYQGESNHFDGMLYVAKTQALVEGWRKLWGQGDFPYYYVQIAPFQYGTENPFVLPTFWEAQNAIMEAVPNTGMVVVHDIGNLQDIHPKNKQDVGKRLAGVAMAKTYGQAQRVCYGPTYKSVLIEGEKLRVVFDHVGGGLASRDGKPLNCFEIIGGDTDFVPANATIDGNAVVLSAPQVKQPAAVRFAWHKLAEPNLMNKEGLPAVPFRAGKVPERDFLALRVPGAKEYALVYALDLAKLAGDIRYDIDNHAKVGAFDRVAYFLELQKPGEETQYVYVAMDAFTNDAGKIGIPTLASKAFFQQIVKNLSVVSNVNGVATGQIPEGNIEFWPNNYGTQNSAKIPNASDGVYDWGDQPTDPEDGYGCMQVHNFKAKHTIFAINNWKSGGGANIGIGNSTGQTLDWTFCANAGTYSVKKLRVLVHEKK